MHQDKCKYDTILHLSKYALGKTLAETCYCLELEVRVAGSQETGSIYGKTMNRNCTIMTQKIVIKIHVCMHTFACSDVTNKNEKKNMHAAQTLTHAALRMRKKVHFVYEIKKLCLLNSGSVTFRKLTTSTCENY